MVYVCAVAECNSNRKSKRDRGQELIFHSFPKNPDTAKDWVVKCKREDTVNPENARICSDHFTEKDYDRDLQNELLGLPPRKKLKSSAVHSLFPLRKLTTNPGRELRVLSRERRQLVKEIIALPSENTNCENSPATSISSHSAENEKEDSRLTEPFKSKDAALEVPGSFKIQQRIQELECTIVNQRKEIIRLHSVINAMKSKQNKANHQLPRMFNILTDAQRKKLSGGKRVNWSVKDITTAMSIRSISLKAYNSVRRNLKIPLPAVSTLTSWARKFSCAEGVLTDVLEALRMSTQKMDHFSRLSVLLFDEISLDSTNVLDPLYLKITSQSKAQVVMLRGLCANWKQPVYYGFNTNMTVQLLNEIIIAVEKAGFLICANTCDLGPENRSLMKELKISSESSSFPNPTDSTRNIYTFADIPHCLKNVRNHVLDQGVILEDGTSINKNLIKVVLSQGGSELKLCPKVSLNSLELSGAERMRVRPAAQLLSHHMATLAWKCFPKNPSVGNFFQILNDGFDVLNSRIPRDKVQPLKSGFGQCFESQLAALAKLKHLIQTMRFKTNKGNIKNVLLPCQEGFLISITSLEKLYNDLKCKYNVSYVLSSRLNQHSLENLFARIRSFGGPNTHPTACEFRYRLRLVILGSQTKPPAGCNVDKWENADSYLAEKLLGNNTNPDKKQLDQAVKEDILKSLNKMDNKNQKLDPIELDSLSYLAGYLARKLSKRGNLLQGHYTGTSRTRVARATKSTPWVEMLSRGGLVVPNNSILNATITLEKSFRLLYPYYCKSNYCELKLFHHMSQLHSSIDEFIVRSFIRTRLGIKVRYLNEQQKIKSNVNGKKCKQFVKSSMHGLH